jgi:hypothetical protein
MPLEKGGTEGLCGAALDRLMRWALRTTTRLRRMRQITLGSIPLVFSTQKSRLAKSRKLASILRALNSSQS